MITKLQKVTFLKNILFITIKRNTGLLCYGRQTVAHEKQAMESTERALQAVQCDYEKLGAEQLRNRFKGE